MDANNNFISTYNNNGLVPQIRQMMNELIQGRDLAKHLQSTLSSSSSQSQSKEWLMIQRIIESFEKSIEILKSEPFYNQQSPLPIAQTTTDSPHSGFSGSPKSQDSDGDYSFKDLDLKSSDHLLDPRKRKLMVPVEKRRVPGSSDSGLEGPIEDGYSWRKYGQKDILGATYPRAYYRCTFRQGQGCFATKQVQRNDDDPTLFDVVYRGKHTCSQAPSSSSLLNPTDSIKLEPSETLPYHHHQKQQSHGVIWSFGSEPKDIKPIITNNKLMHHSSSYFTFQYPSQNPTSSCDHQAPTSFPYDNNNHITTTNHGDFSTNFNPNDQQHAIHLQSEVVPATSGTDSPAMAVPAPRFSFDQGEFDQHDIMFDIPEFY